MSVVEFLETVKAAIFPMACPAENVVSTSQAVY